MKRKSIALLLALTMCLSLLSACGGDNVQNTGEPASSDSTPSTTEQQPADEQEEQPSQELEQTEPEESEEPTQEPEENEGTKFLALLQEEYKNGFFAEGDRPEHTFYRTWGTSPAFIVDGVVYVWSFMNGNYAEVYSYDIASKSLSMNQCESKGTPKYILNDTVYGDTYYNNMADKPQIVTFDYTGTIQKAVDGRILVYSDKDIWAKTGPNEDTDAIYLYTYDLEKIADFPTTFQAEVAHGIKEDVYMSVGFASETLYAQGSDYSGWYRLNMDTSEWEACENLPKNLFELDSFCGKYGVETGIGNGIVYDEVTGEQVFEFGTLPTPATATYGCFGLCYFGGDKYLGKSGDEYKWVNLTDLSVSEPLPFPEHMLEVTVLSDTYCVYMDEYGLFLLNYNTGDEETIVMFED